MIHSMFCWLCVQVVGKIKQENQTTRAVSAIEYTWKKINSDQSKVNIPICRYFVAGCSILRAFELQRTGTFYQVSTTERSDFNGADKP